LPPQANAQLRGLIYLALASAYDGTGDLEKSTSAYAETIRCSRLGGNVSGISITFRLIGGLRLLGRLRAAEEACREALAYVREQGMARLPATGVLHVAMSEVLVEQNEFEAAQVHLARGKELGKWSGRMDAVKNTAYSLSRLRLARHDASGALAAIQESEASLEEPRPPLAVAELLALKARILVQQGSLSEAAQVAEEAARLAGRDRGQTSQLVALAACRVLLARCKPEEAVAQLTRDIEVAEGCGRLGVVIELCILRSLVLQQQGASREAEADLQRALALAEPEGYVRLFLDEVIPCRC
jgi:LuxR family maltose regulon positive regulatory protein